MLTIEVKTAGAQAELAAVGARARDLSSAMARIGQQLLADIHANFRGGGVFPERWKPIKRPGQILVRSGLLRRSMQQSSGTDFARAGSGLLYARIHQEGGTVLIPARWQPVKPRRKGSTMQVFARRNSFLQRKTGTVSGRFLPAHDIHIPARPFLPVRGTELSAETAGFVRTQIGSYVVEGRS
jgi:phage gpG-like protein